MAQPRILLVNPPIYDFSAYDFWLKPLGLLRIGGYLRKRADLRLFDFLDRLHPAMPESRDDSWGRGKIPCQVVEKPAPYKDIQRSFKRYGLAGEVFLEFLERTRPFDFALVQTGMTYWYPGVAEVLSHLRRFSPETAVVLGGVYCSLCPNHARSLGADLIVEGHRLGPLWDFVRLSPDTEELPFWEGYPELISGVLKLSDGCPFRCTYCSTPILEPCFRPRPTPESVASTRFLSQLGAADQVFYDDALLHRQQEILFPFLDSLSDEPAKPNFHTPNALNARLLTPEAARRMVSGGFRSFYLGYESNASGWQQQTGAKVYAHELERAVGNLFTAGAEEGAITCYILAGHPRIESQEVEGSIAFAHSLGVQVMLSEFSPIPGTPDGELCREWVDLSEPLNHNKLAFAHWRLGPARLQELKDRANGLNRSLKNQARCRPGPSHQHLPLV